VDRAVNGSPNRIVARIPEKTGLLEVRRKELDHVRLDAGVAPSELTLSVKARNDTILFHGTDAIWAAGHLLPALNRFGGTKRQVNAAVDILEVAGDAERTFASAARMRGRDERAIHNLDYPVRLALEMAAHEEQERRALEGELAMLETAWKEAEEVASISDSLLLPTGVEEWMKRLRGK
jgi:hypothetical protein